MAEEGGGNNNSNQQNQQAADLLKRLREQESAEQRVLSLLEQIERQKKLNLDLEVKEYELGERKLEQEQKEIDLLHKKLSLDAENNKGLEEYLKTLATVNKFKEAGKEIDQKVLDQLKDQHKALDEGTKKQLKEIETKQRSIIVTQRVRAAYQSVSKAYAANIETLSELTGVNMNHLKSMKAIGKESFNRARGLDDINKTMALQTGYTQSLQKQMGLLYRDSSRTGLLYKEQAEILAGLSNEYKDFNALTTDAQEATFDLARKFKVQGVEGAQFAKVLHLLNRGLGITGTQGLKAAASFEKIAMKTGRPLTAILKDFEELGPQIARFGNQATDVFERLQVQARQLGMESKKIFEIGELFDTFESSADAAGRLNAQFGTQLESVNLMAMDHAERFATVRGEFNRMGLAVDKFDRRNLQMLASIMKVDEATARQMFGDPMQMRRVQREMAINEERQKGFLTAQKRMQVAYEKFYMSVEPLLVKIMDFFGDMAESFDDFFSSSVGRAMSSVVLLAGKFYLLLTPVRLVWKAMKFVWSGLSAMFEPVAKIGQSVSSAISKIGQGLARLARPLAFLAKPLRFLLKGFGSLFFLAKDLIGSTGLISDDNAWLGKGTFMDMSQEASQARLAGGAAGAGVGAAAGAGFAGVGAGVGALWGYGIGRKVPEMTGAVNDFTAGPIVHAAGVKGRADDLRITDAEGRLLQLGTFGENRQGRGRETSGGSNQMGPITVKELTLPITLQLEGTQLDFIERAVDIVLDPMVVRG